MTRKVKEDTTCSRLISAGLKLFSQNGYDATSTRMIAQEAGVNLSAISFHFSSKERLFAACLDFIAGKTAGYYSEIYAKIKQLLADDTISREEVYSCLKEIVDLQISAAFGSQYRSSLNLIYWEHINSMKVYHPVTSVFFEKIEKSMAMLITAVTDLSYEKAMIASRYINGSVIAFGEHSQLVQYALGNEDNLDQELSPWIRKEIQHYCDVVIRDLLKL